MLAFYRDFRFLIVNRQSGVVPLKNESAAQSKRVFELHLLAIRNI
jgi:hypothetical protein